MEITNKEIKDILDAFDRGEEMQVLRNLVSGFKWVDIVYDAKNSLLFDLSRDYEIRVKPQLKVIELFTYFTDGKKTLGILSEGKTEYDTHKISYLLDEENNPVLDSFKIELL